MTGSWAKGGLCVPLRVNHHGLIAFEKLHRDDWRRKFKRGVSKLRALVHLSGLRAVFSIPAGNVLKRTKEEKIGLRRSLWLLWTSYAVAGHL